jgi:hypothetical protein
VRRNRRQMGMVLFGHAGVGAAKLGGGENALGATSDLHFNFVTTPALKCWGVGTLLGP